MPSLSMVIKHLLVGGLSLGAAVSSLSGQATYPSAGEWETDRDAIIGHFGSIAYQPVPSRTDNKVYTYTSSCYVAEDTRTNVGCIDGRIPPPSASCDSGDWIEPRWSQVRDAEGNLGPYTLEASWTCPGDPDFPLTLDDITRLPISPSRLSVQPSSGWVLAGLETVMYSDKEPQGFFVELLGLEFRVVAVPVEFNWDFGDGSAPISTRDPGAPWPNQTVAHEYSGRGRVTPRLTTSWKGYVMRMGGTRWGEVPGVATTVTTGDPIIVYTARTRLVEDPLSS